MTAPVGVKNFLSLIVALLFVVPAVADDRSHRVIETPQLNGVDFFSQMEMLRRLQSLADQLESPETPQQKTEKLPEGVTADDLEKLRKLYNRIGAVPPRERRFESPEFPPGRSQRDRTQQPTDHEHSKLLEELMQRLSGKKPQTDPNGLEDRSQNRSVDEWRIKHRSPTRDKRFE